MSLLKNISIRLKIALVITAISTLSVLLSLLFNLTSDIRDTKRDLKNDAQKEARLLGDYCVMPIEFNYPNRAKDVLNTRISRGNIATVSIYNKHGELFAVADKAIHSIPDSATISKADVYFEGNNLFILEPILHNGLIYGSVFMVYTTGLKTEIIRNILTAIILLLIIGLLSFGLALQFQKIISIPILNLAKKASEVSATQNYDTNIQKPSNDEIGTLYDSFNKMLKTLKTREIEKEKAQQAMQLSEAKFKNIFEFSLDGILVTNMEGEILEANSRTSELFKLPTEELKGKSLLSLLPPTYKKQRSLILSELDKKGKFTFVSEYFSTPKQEMFIEFSSRIILHNNTKAILSLIRDITKKIKADDALRESEERYKKLVENFPSAIALHREGEILFVNDAIKPTLYGRSKNDFIGRKMLDFIAKDYKDSLYKHFLKVEEQNAPVQTIEIKMVKLNGKVIDAEMSSIPLYFNRRKAILSVFKDISTRKKTEKDLVIALKQAEESDKLKSSFLANMSHEIRTPMNGIIGFADLLRKEDLTKEDSIRYVDVIKSSADRLLSIINDIIDISKIEAGAINVINEDFDFKILANEIFQFFIPQAERKSIQLILNENTADEAIPLSSDRTKVSQIITNLLSNAIKFTKQGKVEFSLSTNHENNTLLISVKDTGMGIPRTQLNTIFERFRQADHYLQKFNEGTGLGLSICKGFAQALGGDIWVESEFEKGAEFFVELPLKDLKKTQQKPLETIPENQPSKKTIKLKDKNILIVEDEEYNYVYLKEILEPKGVKLLWADDGLKAIQLVLNNPQIDFVLMDIKLPVMDGFTAAKRIKSLRKSLPIVAQTAFGLEGDKEKTISAGLDDYIAKPIIKEQLFNIIEKHI